MESSRNSGNAVFGSENLTVILTDVLLNQTNFDLVEHRAQLSKAGTEAQSAGVALKESVTKEVADAAKGVLLSHWFKRAKVAGGWLTCIPNRLNGTKLSAEEFRDNLRLCFGLKPSGLPKLCDTHSTARREGCS